MGDWAVLIGSGGWHVMSVVPERDVSPREVLGMSKVVVYAVMGFGGFVNIY